MKKIAVLVVGVLIVMGMVVSPVLAQLPGLPGMPEEPQQEMEVQLPDYSGWQVVQAMGFDTDLDGVTDYYTKVYNRKKVENNNFVEEAIQLFGKFGEEPKLVIWMAVETIKTDQGDRKRPKFQRPIIRKDDGKYYEPSPQVFQAKAKEFFEALPQYDAK